MERQPLLGASLEGDGARFVLAAPRAERVELCLFDDQGREERLALERRADGRWSRRVAGIGPGQLYGYRVHGPFDLAAGLACDPSKLLVDPRAGAIHGGVAWRSEVLTGAGPGGHDSAPFVPRSVVVDPRFDWGADEPPRTPLAQTLIYELHVKGMTARHPELPPELRGTYEGLASEPVVEHLRALGVTAVELLPIHHRVSERALAERGLSNYWGYSTLGYFAPDARFARGAHGAHDAPVREFQRMVRALHAAGIEVLLDVVYNHTCESDERGATLCFKGIDLAGHYRLSAGESGRYVDWTGCHNTLDASRPLVQELVLDSLRYWVREMRVDGFRFDLAPVIGREPERFDPEATILRRIREDPLLSGVKLIAEGWDSGPGGHLVGAFPRGWSEWNDRFRDDLRRFWFGHGVGARTLAARLDGSPDVFAGRAPSASVDFVASHDGFTLADLVAYRSKHNEANGEDNRDGPDWSWNDNFGAEGPTEDATILAARERVRRALLASLALTRGVPMLGHGDELGRGQQGNNNAYCQDSPLTWIDWRRHDGAFLELARAVFAARARWRPAERALAPWSLVELAGGLLRPEPGPAAPGAEPAGLAAMHLHAPASSARRPAAGSLLALCNAGEEERLLEPPPGEDWSAWRVELASGGPGEHHDGARLRLPARSLLVLARS